MISQHIFKTALSNGTAILSVDTIEHNGGLWLVPIWIADADGSWRTPARVIRLDTLAHKKLGPPQPYDYHLLDPIPQGILDGSIAPKDAHGFVVIERPEIRRPAGMMH